MMTVPLYPAGGENFYRPLSWRNRTGSRPCGNSRSSYGTVDSVLPASPCPITFIKCDVEGHEAEALEGGAQTIERDHPPSASR